VLEKEKWMLELNRLQVFSNVTQLIADLFMKCDLNVVQSSCSLIPVKGAISFLTSVGGESFDSKHDQKKKTVTVALRCTNS
jgi:hypothetical protein